jgi:hypothetical protein
MRPPTSENGTEDGVETWTGAWPKPPATTAIYTKTTAPEASMPATMMTPAAFG